jgi:hypothetical protein
VRSFIQSFRFHTINIAQHWRLRSSHYHFSSIPFSRRHGDINGIVLYNTELSGEIGGVGGGTITREGDYFSAFLKIA